MASCEETAVAAGWAPTCADGSRHLLPGQPFCCDLGPRMRFCRTSLCSSDGKPQRPGATRGAQVGSMGWVGSPRGGPVVLCLETQFLQTWARESAVPALLVIVRL